jgi:hypothetical protein
VDTSPQEALHLLLIEIIPGKSRKINKYQKHSNYNNNISSMADNFQPQTRIPHIKFWYAKPMPTRIHRTYKILKRKFRAHQTPITVTFSTDFTFLRNFLPFEPALSSWWSDSAAFFSSFAFLPSSVASYNRNQPHHKYNTAYHKVN